MRTALKRTRHSRWPTEEIIAVTIAHVNADFAQPLPRHIFLYHFVESVELDTVQSARLCHTQAFSLIRHLRSRSKYQSHLCQGNQDPISADTHAGGVRRPLRAVRPPDPTQRLSETCRPRLMLTRWTLVQATSPRKSDSAPTQLVPLE